MTKPISQLIITRQVKQVARIVAQYLGLSLELMMANTRDRGANIIEGRMLVMWVSRYGLDLSWTQIKRATGRDHSTVINACRRMGVIMTEDPFWRDLAHKCLGHVEQGEFDVQVDPIPLPDIKTPAKVVEPKPSVHSSTYVSDPVSLYDRDGPNGTNRAFLEAQNQRMLDALQRAAEEEAAAAS